MALKRYRGERARDGTVRVYVDGDGRRALPHLVRHSPDGFEYGALSPGAADLGCSILGDYLGGVPAEPLYRRFTRDFIRPLDAAHPWTISEPEIAAWLAAFGSQGMTGTV